MPHSPALLFTFTHCTPHIDSLLLLYIHPSINYIPPRPSSPTTRSLVQETLSSVQTPADRANVCHFVRQVVELLSHIVSSLQRFVVTFYLLSSLCLPPSFTHLSSPFLHLYPDSTLPCSPSACFSSPLLLLLSSTLSPLSSLLPLLLSSPCLPSLYCISPNLSDPLHHSLLENNTTIQRAHDFLTAIDFFLSRVKQNTKHIPTPPHIVVSVSCIYAGLPSKQPTYNQHIL